MTHADEGKIELLSIALLDEHRQEVIELRKLARSLRLEFGWHYLLDITWILGELGPIQGKRIMDAGAGTGVLQWYLAQRGAEVISVDRLSRAALPLRFRTRFGVTGLRDQDLLPPTQALRAQWDNNPRWRARLGAQAREVLGMAHLRQASGRVIIYNQDLRNLSDIADDSLDAVLALSALEHNQPQALEQVVGELMRVLKPGGSLIASLTAARDQDWWHEPSSGWCYTDASLRRLFHLPESTHSNYAQFDRLLAELRDCAELRDNLARFYFNSADNGMPLGKWDPQYIPVGVLKIKKA
ncbi:MAG: methyltransferase domain-containing protein [Anaerolineales bacterium]|jgi:2-polyprenyl-3-methyl-5-hydroxy-6-metoxy-1,4-benzoquinol methylase